MSHTIQRPSKPAVAATGSVPYPLAKRLFDRCVAALLIVVLSPVLLFALVVLALDMLLAPHDRGRWLYQIGRAHV